MLKSLFVLKSVLLASLTIGARCAVGEDDPAAIMNRSVEERLRIRQWHLKVTHTIDGENHQNVQFPETEEYWTAGESYRVDVVQVDDDGSLGLKDPRYCEKNIHHAGEVLNYSTRKYLDGSKDAISVHQVGREGTEKREVVDIRGIGMSPNGCILYRSPDAVLTGPDTEYHSVEREVLDEIDVYRVEMSYRGAKVTAWIAPSKGWSPVRFEAHRDFEGMHAQYTSDVTVKEWPSGIWFPERVTVELRIDDTIDLALDSRIEEAEFNQDFAPEVFSVAGLGAPPGTAVYKIPDSKYANLLWDGEKIIKADLRSGPIVETAGQVGSTRRFLLLFNVFALCVICIVCFWKFRAKRQK